MFDLLETRAKPEIKWWTLPAAIGIVFLAGVNAGILIGQRVKDFDKWLEVIFQIVLVCVLLPPILRELLLRQKEANDDVR
jgi:hypothetical protein